MERPIEVQGLSSPNILSLLIQRLLM